MSGAEEDPLSLAWSWVVETLADTDQVDTPLLDDLLSSLPNGYDSLSYNTKERLALRRLEHKFATPNPRDFDPTTRHSFSPAVSEPAQDVYSRLLDKELDASSSSAVRRFVLCKKAQLHYCKLEELEDLLINGFGPIAESLRKASGFAVEQGEDCGGKPDQSPARLVSEDQDKLAREDVGRGESPNSTANIVMEMQADFGRFVSKNLGNLVQDDCEGRTPNSTANVDTEMHTRLGSENLDNQGHDACGAEYLGSTTKMDVEMQEGSDNHLLQNNCGAKSPNSTTEMDAEVQGNSTGLVSENPDNLVQDDSGVKSPNSTKRNDMEVQAHSTCLVSENLDNLVQGDPTSTTMMDMEIAQADSTHLVSENHKNLVQEDCGAKSSISITMVDVEKHSNSINLVSEDLYDLVQEDCSAKSLNSSKKMDMRIMQADSTHVVPENNDNIMQENCSTKSPESSTKIDREMRSVDAYSIEKEFSEYDYCIKCKKRGNLLVCSGGTCRIAVHKSCLNCEPSFDGMGNFFCPICSNLQASIALEQKMKKFERAKEKVMLAKARLDKFNAWKAEKEDRTRAGEQFIRG